jgi:DNA-binding HxlR family transcriptional regulator
MHEELERRPPDRYNDWLFNRILWLIQRTQGIRGYGTDLRTDSNKSYPGRESFGTRPPALDSMIDSVSETHHAIVTALLSAGIGTFSGKWKLSILWYLRQRSRRFGELACLLPGITSKVLTYQLRELVEAGLVSRKETNAPRQTRYALTESGIDAMPLLQLLYEWGHRRVSTITSR